MNKSRAEEYFFECVHIEEEEVKPKRRYRRCSDSDLQFMLAMKKGDVVSQIQLTSTPYEELYNANPKRKTRVRKDAEKVGKKAQKGNHEEEAMPKPLASSTPCFKSDVVANRCVNNLTCVEENEESTESSKYLFIRPLKCTFHVFK